MAMQCPRCYGKTKVIDSRPTTPDLPSGKRMHFVVRRRECLLCTTRFTTWETIVEGSVKPKTTSNLMGDETPSEGTFSLAVVRDEATGLFNILEE